MTFLPAKRARLRSGILREAPREFPAHRRWLRSHDCVVSLRPGYICEGPIEVSHLRNAANSGTGIKPRDNFAVPMCRRHHAQYHQHGHETFQGVYRLDLFKLAAEFTKRTTDKRLREAMHSRSPSSASDEGR